MRQSRHPLRFHRQLAQLTQERLAKRARVKRVAIIRAEVGRRNLCLRDGQRIARVLGIPVESLGELRPNPPRRKKKQPA